MELYVVFLPADVEDLDFSVKRESEFAADSRYLRTASAPKPAQAKSKVPYFKDSGRKNEGFCWVRRKAFGLCYRDETRA